MNSREFLLANAEKEGLDSFDASTREKSFDRYLDAIKKGELSCDTPKHAHNMHCHSFFSYNCFGWSPEHLALTAKLIGLTHLGMVDFDVLDGVNALKKALKKTGLKNIAGIETRVFTPELADVEINSPGEKGVAYHLALGFESSCVPESQKSFLASLKTRAQERTAAVVEKVNAYLTETPLDFKGEVVAATPCGNPTERHVCGFYRKKADNVFGTHSAVLDYWHAMLKLNDAESAKAAKSESALEGFIRSKLMKNGGPGAIKADAGSFPLLDEMNAFAAACGAVPCPAWLNGFSIGESDALKLLSFHKDKGAKAVTIIPERNWNIADPEKKMKSIANLDAVINAALKLELPVLAGTELNSPGQRLYDAFYTPEIAKYYDVFKAGADALTVISKR